ncbi:hypothetical protein ACFP1Z_05860 [Streptomyces gamaensis]|uniref:J domain-containing protein n=1 Tax=Streptomyces gamaensis TaxID=1763542 RepID=A0ABW0YT32_9ACTN
MTNPGAAAEEYGAGAAYGPQEQPPYGPGPDVRRLEQAVRAAEQALIEFEIAVETFRVEVENFSRLHHERLGPLYARLEELDAAVAEAVAARTGDAEDLRRAREARLAAQPLPGVAELFGGLPETDAGAPREERAAPGEQPVPAPRRVRPSDGARRAYRELIRKAHPDLAADEAERARREAFVVRVNAAYADGDEALLGELAAEWAAGPAPEPRPLDRAEELAARLEWLARRKELLAVLAAELEESAIASMLRMAPDDPDGLLEEIARGLREQLAEREARLAALVG